MSQKMHNIVLGGGKHVAEMQSHASMVPISEGWFLVWTHVSGKGLLLFAIVGYLLKLSSSELLGLPFFSSLSLVP